MESSTIILLSGALTYGVPILLAVRELVALRRHRDGPGGPGGGRRPATPVPPKPRGGAPTAPRPLPACLIEAARGAPAGSRPKVRPELETA